MKLCLATKNPGKLKELLEISKQGNSNRDIELVLAPQGFNPKETGSSFLENAIIKAADAAKLSGMVAVADDSGICVKALGGRPGILSARYSEGDEALGRSKLLGEMQMVPDTDRQAAFVCAMAVVDTDGKILFSIEKQWRGVLAKEEKGANGFGYDPIFIPEGESRTSAQLAPEQKNLVSHRGQAWREVLNFLNTYKTC